MIIALLKYDMRLVIIVCKELHCTGKEADSLIMGNPDIFLSCEIFSSHLLDLMGLKRYEPNELCYCLKEGWRFIRIDATSMS